MYTPNIRKLVVSFDPEDYPTQEDLCEELQEILGEDSGCLIEKFHCVFSNDTWHFYAHTETETLRFCGDIIFDPSDSYQYALVYWPSHEGYKYAS
jgi:hypothetical protein